MKCYFVVKEKGHNRLPGYARYRAFPLRLSKQSTLTVTELFEIDIRAHAVQNKFFPCCGREDLPFQAKVSSEAKRAILENFAFQSENETLQRSSPIIHWERSCLEDSKLWSAAITHLRCVCLCHCLAWKHTYCQRQFFRNILHVVFSSSTRVSRRAHVAWKPWQPLLG